MAGISFVCVARQFESSRRWRGTSTVQLAGGGVEDLPRNLQHLLHQRLPRRPRRLRRRPTPAPQLTSSSPLPQHLSCSPHPHPQCRPPLPICPCLVASPLP